MNKIILVLLATLSIFGCGKKEKGVVFMANKSKYNAKVAFSQYYSSSTEYIHLSPGQSKNIMWTDSYSCWLEEPHFNLVNIEESKEKYIITTKDSLTKYNVINGLCKLKLLDENQYILANQNKEYVTNLEIETGASIIYFFIKDISINNLILDKGNEIEINGKKYNQIDKVGDNYYFNESVSSTFVSTKINIYINGNTIYISK